MDDLSDTSEWANSILKDATDKKTEEETKKKSWITYILVSFVVIITIWVIYYFISSGEKTKPTALDHMIDPKSLDSTAYENSYDFALNNAV